MTSSQKKGEEENFPSSLSTSSCRPVLVEFSPRIHEMTTNNSFLEPKQQPATISLRLRKNYELDFLLRLSSLYSNSTPFISIMSFFLLYIHRFCCLSTHIYPSSVESLGRIKLCKRVRGMTCKHLTSLPLSSYFIGMYKIKIYSLLKIHGRVTAAEGYNFVQRERRES